MTDTQLAALAKPWQDRDIKAPAPGQFGDYVPHYIAEQKALAIVGAHSFEVLELIRGDWDGFKKDSSGNSVPFHMSNVVVGCLARLTCEVDGRTVSITEVGDCEKPHNWMTDGARAKDAASDAYKRCWMRLGLGLHLYVKFEKGERYFLHDVLTHSEVEVAAGPVSPPGREAGAMASSKILARESDDVPAATPFTVGEATLTALQARVSALLADHAPVADSRKAWDLPPIKPGLTVEQAARWEELIGELETNVTVGKIVPA